VGYFDYATVGSRLKTKVAHYPKVHLPSTVYDRHQPIRRNRKTQGCCRSPPLSLGCVSGWPTAGANRRSLHTIPVQGERSNSKRL